MARQASGGRARGLAVTAMVVVARVAAADPPPSPSPSDDELELRDLSLEDLLAIRVVTPARAPEPLAEAPAKIIVLTRDDLRRRGYQQLADIFDDLPGMDVIRPWGDNWFAAYARGDRRVYGSSFLVMLDGVIFNDLWFLDDEVLMSAYPITAIDRVEIVYGPVSAAYGANALAGVINIITRPAGDDLETVRIGVGSLGRRVLDATYGAHSGELSMRASFRYDEGHLDEASNEGYEYSRSSYADDRRLWGGFLDNPALRGFHSRFATTAADLRLVAGDTELAIQHLAQISGYGVAYATDRVLPDGDWHRQQLSIHLRNVQHLAPTFTATTLVRYRETNFPADSWWIDGGTDATLGRVAGFTYWQSQSASWSAFEDVQWTPPVDDLSVVAGVKLERKDLTKAYETTGARDTTPGSGAPGAYTPIGDLHGDSYPYPTAPSSARRPENRILTEDVGGYAEARYQLAPAHRVHLGARLDHDSVYGYAPTVRGGYVGRLGSVVWKALYGEGFQEPAPRHLYGGWTGAGSDPTLEPERARSFELGGSYASPDLAATVSGYYDRLTNTVEATAAGGQPAASNVGARNIVGVEVSLQGHLCVPYVDQVTAWIDYTRILMAQEVLSADAPGGPSRSFIGDLARDKVQAGASILFTPRLSLVVRGRFIGRRDTVATNPVGSVDPFATFDAYLLHRDLIVRGVSAGLLVQNLTGARYFNPGVNDASAGTTPGVFAADGTYTGSGGYYNSLLAQPGRTIMVTLALER